MNTKRWILIVASLGVIIILLAWLLWVTPASAPVVSQNSQATTSTSAPADSTDSDQALTVTTPKPNVTVGHSFTVAGTAPSAWFFEGTFPMQVRDDNDDIVGRAPAQAQGDWETSGLVTFTATMSIDATFHGSATLILNKDNPSGLPQNDDSMQVPIVVQ